VNFNEGAKYMVHNEPPESDFRERGYYAMGGYYFYTGPAVDASGVKIGHIFQGTGDLHYHILSDAVAENVFKAPTPITVGSKWVLKGSNRNERTVLGYAHGGYVAYTWHSTTGVAYSAKSWEDFHSTFEPA